MQQDKSLKSNVGGITATSFELKVTKPTLIPAGTVVKNVCPTSIAEVIFAPCIDPLASSTKITVSAVAAFAAVIVDGLTTITMAARMAKSPFFIGGNTPVINEHPVAQVDLRTQA
jgi:hypothetical protein